MALCFMSASSAPINQAKAKFIASRFLEETKNRDAKSLDLKSANIHADVAENKPYYVFNAENGGFVIVSGDDNARQILGYSDSGTFGENIPPQLQELLNEYATQISNIPADAVSSSINVKTSSEEKVLQTANWDQYAPYNDLCPNGYPSGCVATAMAIVMKYHNWPQSGTGSHSYEWNGQTISYDFSQTFDWYLMHNAYYLNNYSEAEGKAVAELMKACGVSVEMNYAADGSAAYLSNAHFSLISFFKYDSRCECIHQDDYNYDEWASMIKSEIDANRPIIYKGEGQGSHAFVCDGYDANDMYHFNWGWDGRYNGFFALSALTPTFNHDYSYSHRMIINIRPEENPIIYSPLEMYSGAGLHVDVENIETGSSFNAFCGYMINKNYLPFNGYIVLALTSESGEIKEIISTKKLSLNPMSSTYIAFTNLKVTSTVFSNDKLQLFTKTDEDDFLLIKSTIKKPSYTLTTNNTNSTAKINYNLYPNTIKVSGLCQKANPSQKNPIFSSRYNISTHFPYNITQTVWEINDKILYRKPSSSYVIDPVSKNEYNISIYGYNENDRIIGKELNITTPGTLSTLLSLDEARRIYDLKLTGTIDARDIYFMRDKMHLLQEIDMSDVTIAAYNIYEAGHLPHQAFYNKSITSIKLPSNLISLDSFSMQQTNIEIIDIPLSVTNIDPKVFSSCKQLHTVIIHNPIPLDITWTVFAGTKREVGILYVPKGCKNAYQLAEEWNLFDQIIEDENPSLESKTIILNNIIYEIFGNEAKVIGYEGEVTDVTFLENITYNGITYKVTSIDENAFYMCQTITSVTIPNSIKSVRTSAFFYCLNLANINLEEGIENIGYNVFYDGAYTHIDIPQSIIEIGYNAFSNPYLKYVISHNHTPAIIYPNSFNFKNSMELYVPTGSKATYETTDYWNKFSQIIEDENIGGINEIVADNTNNVSISTTNGNIIINGIDNNAIIDIYNISGHLIYHGTETSISIPIPGIYFVKLHGKTIKVAL